MFNKIIKNFSGYILSDILAKSVPFLLLPIVARYLSVAEYGDVSLFLTLLELITIVTIFGLHNFYRYSYFNIEKNERKNFSVKVIFFTLINFSIIFSFFIIAYMIGVIDKSYYMFLPVTAFFQSMISFYICIKQVEEKPVKIGIINITQSLVGLGLSIILLYSGFSFDGRIFAIVFTVIIFGIICLYSTIDSVRSLILYDYKKDIVEFYKYGIKSFPTSISWWLRSGMDRVLVGSLLGSIYLGYFSIAMQLSLVISVLSIAINNSVMAKIFHLIRDGGINGNFKLIKLISISFLSVFIISIVYYLFLPLIIDLYLPSKYSFSEKLILPLLLGVVFHGLYLLLSNIFIAVNLPKTLSYISIVGVVIHVFLSLVFVNLYGLKGIIWSSSISYAISSLTLLVVCIIKFEKKI
ncbi:oligosaccharide flippase family protein [Photobacterium damselae subsp. damselae]|uniref:Oligosaccharide flippase family protein n=1 Tax=Photobacterium damselae subsp. damselae TaxID=85581 RepID=A0A850R4G5_PHODD|nr:oligosaccharide flippase family protein [Photobacterium damselae subsp. damselae]